MKTKLIFFLMVFSQVGFSQLTKKGIYTTRGTTIISVASSSSLQKSNADYLCDGTADQSQIQTAVNSLNNGGGMVQLLDGAFSISAPIVITDSNITISGIGAGTILKLADGANCDVFQVYDSTNVYPSNARHIIFKDFTIEGNRANQTDTANGIWLQNIGTAKFQNLWINRCSPYGIMFDQKPTISGSEWNTVDQCYFEGDSIGLRMYECDASSVENCIFNSNSSHGFFIQGSTNQIRIINANATLNGESGGRVDSCYEIMVIGGTYANNGYDGISISASSSAQLIGVTSIENTQAALRINAGLNNKVIGGHFRENVIGIKLENAASRTNLTDVHIDKNTNGILIADCIGTQINFANVVECTNGIMEAGTCDSTEIWHPYLGPDVGTPVTLSGANSHYASFGRLNIFIQDSTLCRPGDLYFDPATGLPHRKY